METLTILLPIGGLAIGLGLSWMLMRPRTKSIESTARREAEQLRGTAQKESERLLQDARKHVEQLRSDVHREDKQMRERLENVQTKMDERIAKRESQLDEKIERSESARERYEEEKRLLEEKQEDLTKHLEKQTTELEKISKLSREDAKQALIERIEGEVSGELAETLRRKVDLMRDTADEESSNIIVQALQRYAAPVTAEATVSVVKIESDSLKGKIIGREGRNINAFEQMTGVDVIIDDTPGTITISSFDQFRRYVAKVALEALIKDGRIHPSKIEEMVHKAQERSEKMLQELGQQAAQELGIANLPTQILKLIGRLRFRTSYGQNVLAHSIEVAYIAEAIAEQIPGANPDICKKAGLVHDIGKSVSHEVEGGHALIGMEILEKFGIEKPVIVAMKSHHEDFPYESIEARILQAADAISASRPGARRETLEKYIKRLKELEAIASGFDGIEKVFAIQAGREVRVFVNAANVDDLQSEKLSFEIARKIEKSCEYPGEVRVAVFRESRYDNIAK
jgi:ribonucrease Y